MFLLRLPHLNVLWRGSVHFCSSNITIKKNKKKNWEFSWNLTTEKQYIKKLKKEKKEKKKRNTNYGFITLTKLRINHDVQNQNPFFPTLSIQQQMHSIDFRTTLEFFLIYFTFFTFFFLFFLYCFRILYSLLSTILGFHVQNCF